MAVPTLRQEWVRHQLDWRYIFLNHSKKLLSTPEKSWIWTFNCVCTFQIMKYFNRQNFKEWVFLVAASLKETFLGIYSDLLVACVWFWIKIQSQLLCRQNQDPTVRPYQVCICPTNPNSVVQATASHWLVLRRVVIDLPATSERRAVSQLASERRCVGRNDGLYIHGDILIISATSKELLSVVIIFLY